MRGSAKMETFPLVIEMNEKVKLVEDEFGSQGFAVIIKLFQAIYKQGYYLHWDISVGRSFIRDYCLSSVGWRFVDEVVRCCVRRGVFEPLYFEKYKILTSRRIQETFLKATQQGQQVILVKEYAHPFVYSFIKNAELNGQNGNIVLENLSEINKKSRSFDFKETNEKEKTTKRKKEKVIKKKIIKEREKPTTVKKEVKESKKNYPSDVRARNEDFSDYLDVMDEMGVKKIVKDVLIQFIKHLKVNKLIITDDRLESIIINLDKVYGRDDVGKAKEVKDSISKGYKQLPCERE